MPENDKIMLLCPDEAELQGLTHSFKSLESETESEQDPPPCACDYRLENRCSFHRDEYYGLHFELDSDCRDLKHLMEQIQEHEVRQYVYNDKLVGHVVEYLHFRRYQVTVAQIQAITQLVQKRLSNVRSLQFVDTFQANFLKLQCVPFRHFFCTAFNVRPRRKVTSPGMSSQTHPKGSLKQFIVRESALGNSFFAAIGSALHYSNAITELELQQILDPTNLPTTDLHLCWGWLVFGLFHPNSSARVSHLDLSRNLLSMENLRFVEGVMSGGHPAQVLLVHTYVAALRRYGKSPEHRQLKQSTRKTLMNGIPRTRMFALMRASTPFRPLPATGAVEDHILQGLVTEREQLEVFCRLKRWVCLVVPGYGLAWAPAEYVVEVKEVPMSLRTSSPAALLKTAKFWHMIEPDDRASVVPYVVLFLQMTGASERLDGLNVSENRIGCADTFGAQAWEVFHRILHSCPNLTSLNLSNCELNDMSPLVDAYRRGESRLRELILDNNHIGFQGSLDLAMLLIGGNAPNKQEKATKKLVAANLEVLSLLFNNIESSGVRTLLEALKFNQSIRHLGIDYGNTLPPELGMFEFPAEASQWGALHLFERIEVVRAFEAFQGATNIDPDVMLLMWDLLDY